MAATRERETWPFHFTELNHFRIDQIVMLRTKLAQLIKSDRSLFTQDYNFDNIEASSFKTCVDLLHNLNPSIDPKLLSEANAYASDASYRESVESSETLSKQDMSVEGVEDVESCSMSSVQEMDETFSKNIAPESEKIINELVEDYNFSPELVLNALTKLKTEDREELIAFCLEQQDKSIETSPQKVALWVNFVGNFLAYMFGSSNFLKFILIYLFKSEKNTKKITLIRLYSKI